ncbi:MAG: hypothetical protein ACJ8BW_19655 [Ktedonobacteraceae bacterium]
MPQEVQEHHRQAARIETLVQEVAAFPDPMRAPRLRSLSRHSWICMAKGWHGC